MIPHSLKNDIPSRKYTSNGWTVSAGRHRRSQSTPSPVTHSNHNPGQSAGHRRSPAMFGRLAALSALQRELIVANFDDTRRVPHL
jgi:hypothetical protein